MVFGNPEEEEQLEKIYAKLEEVPDDKWREENQYFYTSLGGFTFRLYGSHDDGCVVETGVCVLDSEENVLADHEHAPGLSDVFGRLVKREMEKLESQKEKEIERKKKRLNDFLDK